MSLQSQVIDSWQSLTVLVIGDVMLDSYLQGTADRLCQEAPVPVVAISERQDFPGGAANVAANVSKLGAKTLLLSVTGQDEGHDRLQTALAQHQVVTDYLIQSSQRSTLVKQRVVANSHLLVRLDHGSTAPISEQIEAVVDQTLHELFPKCDVIIISDYGYGVLTPKLIHTLEKLQKTEHQTLVIDSKQLRAYQAVKASVVKPNYQEALQLLGLPKSTQRVEQLQPYRDALLEITGADRIAVTLDCEGVLMFEKNQPTFHLPATPAPTHHTSGAGDTFLSAFALALAANAPASIAAQLAVAATAIVVTQPGTTICSADELRQKFPSARTMPRTGEALGRKTISKHEDLFPMLRLFQLP